jgi:hypothetical protein
VHEIFNPYVTGGPGLGFATRRQACSRMEDYMWYCQHGLDFYDHPGLSDAGTHALLERRVPDGWAVEIVAKHCFARFVPFKVLTHRQTHLRLNGKYAPRGRSGKLITIYPSDPETLSSVLFELDAALEGKQGPYVLSDLRWRNGPLSVRYGGFNQMYTVDDRGQRVLAVRRPDGRLVPDSRGPSFRPPSWVELPDCVAEQQRMAKVETSGAMPYVVRKALHFSNGGGITNRSDPDVQDHVPARLSPRKAWKSWATAGDWCRPAGVHAPSLCPTTISACGSVSGWPRNDS